MSQDATEQPGAEGLLDIARATLLRDIVPGLSGDARFKALMVANAMAIAQRAIATGKVADLPDPAATAAAIRAGHHDGDAAMAATLVALTESRCRISAPKALLAGA